MDRGHLESHDGLRPDLSREDHCYALALAKRLKAMGQPKYQSDGDPRTSGPGFGITVHASALGLPYTWSGRRVVFVNSMSDLSVGAKCPVPAFPQAMAYQLPPWRPRHVSRTREGCLVGRPGKGARWPSRSVASHPEYECDARSGREDQDAELAGSLPASHCVPAHLGQFDDQPIQPAHRSSSSGVLTPRSVPPRRNASHLMSGHPGHRKPGILRTQRCVAQVLKNGSIPVCVGLSLDVEITYHALHIHHAAKAWTSPWPGRALIAGSIG